MAKTQTTMARKVQYATHVQRAEPPHHPSTQPPVGVLEAAIGGNATALSELATAIAVLASNMQPVLRPSEPALASAGNTGPGAPIECNSPLVTEVHRLRAHIEALTSEVNDLNARLQA